MLTCAYCGAPCSATREHVIPAWYCRTPGESETFSARAPITHVRGDMVVKDVCGACNSGVLSDLDAYGKRLYDDHFSSAVYAGETVSFDLDGERFIRWLLKVSYNSARAQEADVELLRSYREVILGRSPLTAQVRCWLHLVAPTRLLPDVARPALRAEAGMPDVQEPAWFRIGQFRLPALRAPDLVQRQVIVNSFAFSILAAPATGPVSSTRFDRFAEAFASSIPAPARVAPGVARVTATAAGDHAAASVYPLLSNYPTRFSDERNPYVVQALKGDLKLVALYVPKELIEQGGESPIADALCDMVSTREKATAFRQRVMVMTDGYDDDPRGLCQIPQARRFFRQVFRRCPFVMLLADPEGGLLKLLAACWLCEDPPLDEAGERDRLTDFLQRAFVGLNQVTHRLAFSDELTRTVSQTAVRGMYEAA